MAYLTEGDLENFILQDIDATFSPWIAEVILMVENYIDTYCDTTFQDVSSEARYFDAYGVDEILIDDCQSVSEVLLLDINGNTEATLAESTDYHLYPLNDSVKSIIKLSPGGSYHSFPERKRAVKVTGIWGRATVPAAIKFAAIRLAAKIINEGLRGGKVSAETLGSYSISYEKIDETLDVLGIREVLNQFRRVSIA